MRLLRTYLNRHFSALALIAALAGCAQAPVLQTSVIAVSDAPQAVAAAPERYHDAEIVWGGSIIAVRNGNNSSEIEILAYPLNEGQRPLLDKPTEGRFIAVLPGYVESLDYPQGRFITFSGHLLGVRSGQVDEHEYAYRLLQAANHHLWRQGFQNDGPQFHFGVGIGVGIH